MRNEKRSLTSIGARKKMQIAIRKKMSEDKTEDQSAPAIFSMSANNGLEVITCAG
jgi:hypothetical protein